VASKRQRKKQQAKQNIKLLEQVGFSRKEAEKVKNKPKQVTTIYKKEKRKITAKDRSDLLKGLGLKVSDHASKRYWSEKKWNDFYNQQLAEKEKARKKAEQKEKQKNSRMGERLFIYWTDPSGSAGPENYYAIARQVEKYPDGKLIEEALWALDEVKPFGEVGEYEIRIADSDKRTDLKEHYQSRGWVKTYEGKAQKMRPLLKTITAMLFAIYNPLLKRQFLSDLVDAVEHFNSDIAEKLNNLFDVD
jgi:hypothetical protein